MPDKIITDIDTLSQISKETTPEECKYEDIFARLECALKASKINGIGLAAIQIGIPLQAAIIRVDKYKLNFMNPEVHAVRDPMLFKGEGCLSVPGEYCTTRRYKYIDVAYLETNGCHTYTTLGNMPAIVFQHELDHMAGKLFLTHKHVVEPVTRDGEKIGRNDPCPCGSTKKYKKCCI